VRTITRACGLLAGFSFVLLTGNGASRGETRNTKSENQVPKAVLLQNYGKLPLSFEANQGQTDHRQPADRRANGHRNRRVRGITRERQFWSSGVGVSNHAAIFLILPILPLVWSLFLAGRNRR
jgi:hypothetical protein